MEAIVADLDTRRHDFHVAIENWQHDFNIGTIVRSANAFLAARGAHRRQAAVEPPRGDGDRPLPARAPPRDCRRPRGAPARAGRRPDGDRQPAGLGAPRDVGDAALGVLPVRPGGPGPLGAGAPGRATAPSRSRSSAPRVRSTPRRPPPSRCTAGSAGTPTSAPPGAAVPDGDLSSGESLPLRGEAPDEVVAGPPAAPARRLPVAAELLRQLVAAGPGHPRVGRCVGVGARRPGRPPPRGRRAVASTRRRRRPRSGRCAASRARRSREGVSPSGSATSWSPLRASTSQRTQRAPRSSCACPGVNSVQVRIEVARSASVPPA